MLGVLDVCCMVGILVIFFMVLCCYFFVALLVFFFELLTRLFFSMRTSLLYSLFTFYVVFSIFSFKYVLVLVELENVYIFAADEFEKYWWLLVGVIFLWCKCLVLLVISRITRQPVNFVQYLVILINTLLWM